MSTLPVSHTPTALPVHLAAKCPACKRVVTLAEHVQTTELTVHLTGHCGHRWAQHRRYQGTVQTAPLARVKAT